MPARIELKWESWDEFWGGGGERLLREEYDEYSAVMALRRFAPDSDYNRASVNIGVLHICVARRRGVPVGYFFLTLAPDPESAGAMSAVQGPWFVRDEPELAAARVGFRLFRAAVALARVAAATDLDLHHPLVGRGAGLDKMFIMLGATPTVVSYRLKLEGLRHA